VEFSKEVRAYVRHQRKAPDPWVRH